MSERKTSVAARLHIRRGVSEAEAALYVGLGVSKFAALVKDGRMPRPRLADSRRIWDIDDLDAAFKDLPIEGGSVASSWDEIPDRTEEASVPLNPKSSVLKAMTPMRTTRGATQLYLSVGTSEEHAVLHRGYLMSKADFRAAVLARPMRKLERRALSALHAFGGAAKLGEIKMGAGTQNMLEVRGFVSVTTSENRTVSWSITDAGRDAVILGLAMIETRHR